MATHSPVLYKDRGVFLWKNGRSIKNRRRVIARKQRKIQDELMRTTIGASKFMSVLIIPVKNVIDDT